MIINEEIKNIHKKILFVDKNINKLSKKNKLIFNSDIIKNFRILYDLLINKKNNYKDILSFIFNRKYKIIINKYQPINNINDIYVLDNLHDFTNKRLNDKINKKFINILRNTIFKYIKNEKILNIIKKNNKIIDINSDVIIDKIFEILKIIKIEGTEGEIKYFNTNKNNIYFETNGIYNMKNCICPYKKIIDKASCNCDDENIRKNLILNNNIINIDNYNKNNIIINITNNELYFNIKNDIFHYYYIFFEKQKKKNDYSFIFNNEYYKLENSINGIIRKIESKFFDGFSSFIDNKLNKEQLLNYLEKYILAGCHLKRLGDYAQLHIFNNSNLTYFQTIDIYCFLYGTYCLNNDKIMLVNNKFIFFKTIFENKQYAIYIKNEKNDFINMVEKKLTDIINSIRNIKKKGGYLKINTMDNNFIQTNDIIKIEKNIEKNIIDKYNMNNINTEILEKKTNDDKLYEDLIDIINNVAHGQLTYLYYKTQIDEFRELLGDNFEFINGIIKKLKNFGLDIDIHKENIRKLYESIIFFKKYLIILDISDKEKYFINVIEKIYNELNINKFNTYASMFADILYNFDKYDDINLNDDINIMFKKIKKIYGKVPEHYDDDGDPIYDENEQKGGVNYLSKIIKLSKKYFKYKTKYLNIKQNNSLNLQ